MAGEEEVKPVTVRIGKMVRLVASAIVIAVSIGLWMDQERTPPQDITMDRAIVDMKEYDRIEGKGEKRIADEFGR